MPPIDGPQMALRLRVARGPARVDRVAAALGITVDRYLQWESGAEMMPTHYVLAFCRITRVSPLFVLAGSSSDDWHDQYDPVSTNVFASQITRPPRPPEEIADALHKAAWRVTNLISGLPAAEWAHHEPLIAALEAISAAERELLRIIDD